jgi:hypothetical protein
MAQKSPYQQCQTVSVVESSGPKMQHISPEAYKNRVRRVGIVNVWADPKFSAAFEATGRNKLVMGGVTTDICLIFPSIKQSLVKRRQLLATKFSMWPMC